MSIINKDIFDDHIANAEYFLGLAEGHLKNGGGQGHKLNLHLNIVAHLIRQTKEQLLMARVYVT
jgi:hypothetical protein